MGAFYVFDLDKEGRGGKLDLGIDGSLAEAGDCVFGEQGGGGEGGCGRGVGLHVLIYLLQLRVLKIRGCYISLNI